MWKAILVAVLVGLVSYWAYEPVPHGTQSPWKYRLAVVIFKLQLSVCNILEALGVKEAYKVTRWISDFSAQQPQIPGFKISDMTIEGVPVRVFEPEDKTQDGPGVLYFHGGGWTIGSVAFYHLMTAYMAKRAGVTLLSVDYRLSPEHVFPAAYDDCLKVTKFFLKHADKFGVDKDRIALTGDSAGGHLTITIAYHLKDDDTLPKIKLQLPIYPVTQAVDLATSSYVQHQHHWLLDKKTMVDFFLSYAAGSLEDADAWMANRHTSKAFKQSDKMKLLDHTTLPRELVPFSHVPSAKNFGDDAVWEKYKSIILRPEFSPLLVDSFKGMPEALVITVQYDVLRDDGLFYVNRLKADGVPVKHIHKMVGFHGVLSFTSMALPEAMDILNDVSDFIKEKL